MAGPGAAHADLDRTVCTDVTGQITGITAVGPGLVAVDGSVTPRGAGTATCDAAAKLIAHSLGDGDADYWYTNGERGAADVRTQDGQFTTGLNTDWATYAVCLETNDGSPLDCYRVTVEPNRDWTPQTPVVGGRISLHRGRFQAPPPCGHCM